MLLNTSMSRHAYKRMQQRGIPPSVLPLLFEFGKEEYDHCGASMLYFNKKARQQIAKVISEDEYKRLANALNTYLIVDKDGVVITLGYRSQRINRN